MADEAEAALIASQTPYYAWSTGLVRPVIETVEAARGHKTTTVRLKEVTAPMLVDRLARVANWCKFNERKKKFVRANPDKLVADIFLTRDGEWKLPPLAAIVTAPTLRPDGSILAEPGYDAATRLLLVDPPAMPPIPDKPTRAEALASLATLNSLLADFPFVDDASRSVVLSGLLSTVVRGAMSVVPLHVMSAPMPGTGKSYLVDLTSAIATGHRAPVIAAGQTDEETEKRLQGVLLRDQPIVSIDNLNGVLRGDFLCQMIERPEVDVRPLGRSDIVRLKSKATVFATGNNIVLAGDMTRRAIVCSLDANEERPELRRFAGDPVAEVLGNRGRYIAAALTIARVYMVAGCPSVCGPFASFDDWSRMVRSALVWLDCADPVGTIEAARADDPELAALREFVAAWHATGSTDRPATVSEIVALAESETVFADSDLQKAISAIAGERGGVNVRKFGYWIKRQQNRIVDGHKIVAGFDTHAGANKWSLRQGK